MRQHPFELLAPAFGLLAFGAAALGGWLSGADSLGLVLRAMVAFVVAWLAARGCARLLREVPPAVAPPVPAEQPTEQGGE